MFVKKGITYCTLIFFQGANEEEMESDDEEDEISAEGEMPWSLGGSGYKDQPCCKPSWEA